MSAAICELSEAAADLPAAIWLWRSPALLLVSLVPSRTAATTRNATIPATRTRSWAKGMRMRMGTAKRARAPNASGTAVSVKAPWMEARAT